MRVGRGAELSELDAKVTEIIGKLKERGIQSPYLRSFVTARINPVRFAKEVTMSPEQLIEKMRALAEKFDVGKVKPEQVTAISAFGGAEED
jgi:ParB family transcriptional regulator, chromosome partitioning protein